MVPWALPYALWHFLSFGSSILEHVLRSGISSLHTEGALTCPQCDHKATWSSVAPFVAVVLFFNNKYNGSSIIYPLLISRSMQQYYYYYYICTTLTHTKFFIYYILPPPQVIRAEFAAGSSTRRKHFVDCGSDKRKVLTLKILLSGL